MSNELKNCPNCNTELTETFFKTVLPLSESKKLLINEFHDQKHELYCDKCGPELFHTHSRTLEKEVSKLEFEISKLINIIPIITIDKPLNWDYEIKSLVTSQASLGTGMLTEFTSGVRDAFGFGSNRYNGKIEKGENLCLNTLRIKAIKQGCNAIISSKIDYSEIGGDKGIMLVCAYGTAIYLKNTDIISNEFKESMEELFSKVRRIDHLKSLI